MLTKIIAISILVFVLLGAGCTTAPKATGVNKSSAVNNSNVAAVKETASTQEPQKLALATTTSTYNSGLLGVLNPVFQKKYNVLIDVHAVGTGAALTMGKDGQVDVVLVHARNLEDKFLEEGYGINRRDVMFNDFIIMGPKNDPAGIKGSKSAMEAFKKIAAAGKLGKIKFLSRGDRSGTNEKELIVWKDTGITPSGKWYQKTGQGMGRTLTIANEEKAYTLSDRGTYLAYLSKGKLDNMAILVQGPLDGGDPLLANPYGVIAVNPYKYPKRNYGLAMLYISFLTSPEGQKIIKDYKKNGQELFYPDAIKPVDDFNQYLPITIHGLYNKTGSPYTGITTLPPTG